MISSSCERAVAFFIPQLNGGGAQRVIVNLANELVDLVDRPIHIVLARAEGEFLSDVRSEVQIFDLETKRASRSVFPLARYIRQVKPIVLCSRMNYVNVIASLAWHISGRNCRLVVSEATVIRKPEGSLFKRLRTIGFYAAIRLMYSFSDTVVANSQETAESLWAIGACSHEQTVVIGNPVLVAVPDNESETPNPIRSILDQNIPYICAVGRLSLPKGFDVLLNAFSRLPLNYLHLVILGEGELRSELREQAQQLKIDKRVHMPGFCRAPEKVIQDAKLFVLSSRWEGFGNVLVEALHTGTPIVSTSCPGGPRDILLNGALGHLVPPENPQALSEAIQEALKLPIGTIESRKSRAQEFSASNIARQYLTSAFKLEIDFDE